MSSRKQFVFPLLLLGAIFVGCSQSDKVEVTGTATWEGQPMPSGEVIFHPTDRSIPRAAGKIINGEFKFPSKPGTMRVEIDAARKTGKRDPIEGFEITELYIPAKYNRSSELKAEVTLDGENHFDFALAP